MAGDSIDDELWTAKQQTITCALLWLASSPYFPAHGMLVATPARLACTAFMTTFARPSSTVRPSPASKGKKPSASPPKAQVVGRMRSGSLHDTRVWSVTLTTIMSLVPNLEH